MPKKEELYQDIKQHSKSFLTRFAVVLSVLTGFVIFTYIAGFMEYGYSSDGKAHHAFLDYPNEIASKDAIRLSEFMESLNALWASDSKINEPFDHDIEQSNEQYWAKEVNVKDPYKRSQVIQDIARDIGLPASKFPVHSPKATGVAESIRGGLPKTTAAIKMGIASPPDYLKIKKPPRAHFPTCDPTKLLQKYTKILAFSSDQFKTAQLKLDGLFSDGGRVNIRTATATEDIGNLKNNIKVNLTLFAENEKALSHVSVYEVDHGTAKSVHINSHHPSIANSCLVYHLDIVFPSKMHAYESLDIKVNHANRIEGDLRSIVFKEFSAGLGRGAINLKNLKAEDILVGTLNGIVLGNYLPIKSLGAAAVKGAAIVNITPQSKHVKSTVVALDGPAKAIITGDNKSSFFTVHCWLCDPTVVFSSKDVHTTSSKRKSIKNGHYKEICSARVNVHSRTGESKIVYA